VTTPLPDQGSPETQACEGISACNSTVADPPATVLGVANDPGSAVIPDEASVQAQKPTHLNEQSNHIHVRQHAIKGEGAPPDTGQGGDMTEPIEAFVMTDTLDDSRVRASINAWKGLSEDADVAATESKADGSHVPGRKDSSEEFQGLRIDKPQAGATPGSFEVGAAASIGSVDTKTPNQGSRLGETTIASQLRCGKKPHAYRPGMIRALPLARTLAHSAQGHIRLLGRHYHPEYGGWPTAQALNSRLRWQLDKEGRGIRFRAVNLSTSRLYVFVDASFAKNRDVDVAEVYMGVPRASGWALVTLGRVCNWSI